MTSSLTTTDSDVLDALRRSGEMGVADLASELTVTRTAVLPRLHRLLERGLVQRHALRSGRGRPQHRYSLTAKARCFGGSNHRDLASALWSLIGRDGGPSVDDVVRSLAGLYEAEVSGTTIVSKFRSLCGLFERRGIAMMLDEGDGSTDECDWLPVLTVCECPYPGLAEENRSVCEMEQSLLSRLTQSELTLDECVLDGGTCCRFQVRS